MLDLHGKVVDERKGAILSFKKIGGKTEFYKFLYILGSLKVYYKHKQTQDQKAAKFSTLLSSSWHSEPQTETQVRLTLGRWSDRTEQGPRSPLKGNCRQQPGCR